MAGRSARVGDQPGRPATRVFSSPPVAFQAASTSSMRSSSFWPSAGSTEALTFEAGLGRVPEQLVEVRDLLDVLGLEVVVPQDVEVVLDQLGPLLLDPDRAGAEGLVGVGLVLLHDPEARFGLDAGLLGVVDAAGEVAMRSGGDGRGKQSLQSIHGTPSHWA